MLRQKQPAVSCVELPEGSIITTNSNRRGGRNGDPEKEVVWALDIKW